MKKILFFTLALLATASTALAQNKLVVPDIEIPQGWNAPLAVNFQFDKADTYTGLSFNIVVPSELSYELKGNGSTDLVVEKGAGLLESHSATGNYASGMAKMAILSLASEPFVGTSGTLLSVTINAPSDVEVGQKYTCTVKDIVLVPVFGYKQKLDDVTFTITIGESGVVLDENSTTMPPTVPGTNVTVKRTIKAGSWSTICLPFAMSSAQLGEAFGNDVVLNNFTGYEVTDESDEGDIIGIKVNFQAVTELEANHPYIIKVTEDVDKFKVSGVDIAPEEQPIVATVNRTRKQWSEFIGTYVANTVVGDQMLFISGNKFWYSTGNTKMRGFRGYFDFYDVLTEVEDSSNANIAFAFDTTDIRGIKNADTFVEGAVYTLGGQLVGKNVNEKLLKRGVYIKDGKKFVVK